MSVNGQATVPPGFRFHPTDEELLYYYLRKKVAYEAIDLDVIREVDLNKLEPWDLKEKCRTGSSSQDEWYFFSQKDKKYPTGTRTNRATAAGFWKATGRDKGIYLNGSKLIGMRKTLVFYIGRAPHGHKTDWIMYEYRLQDVNIEVQGDRWVVCRVFRKKTHVGGGGGGGGGGGFIGRSGGGVVSFQSWQNPQLDFGFGQSMHLPRMLSQEAAASSSPFQTPSAPCFKDTDMEKCSQNLLKLTTAASGTSAELNNWTLLDKLIMFSYHNDLHTLSQNSHNSSSSSHEAASYPLHPNF